MLDLLAAFNSADLLSWTSLVPHTSCSSPIIAHSHSLPSSGLALLHCNFQTLVQATFIFCLLLLSPPHTFKFPLIHSSCCSRRCFKYQNNRVLCSIKYFRCSPLPSEHYLKFLLWFIKPSATGLCSLLFTPPKPGPTARCPLI